MKRVYVRVTRAAGALELPHVSIHPVDLPDILDFMAAVIDARRQAVVRHLNAFAANLIAEHSWLKQVYEEAQLVFCDGDLIRWGLRAWACHPSRR